MSNWQSYSTSYRTRLEDLLDKGGQEHRIFSKVPSAPLSKRPTEQESLHYRSVIALIGAYRSSDELRFSFVENFKSGLFIAASLNSRALIELSGIPRYIENEIITKYERDPSNVTVLNRLERLGLGANGEIPLPWGGTSPLEPINAMEFVRAANATEDYKWLCNASHPSMLQHTYLFFAGRFGDNWSNEVFAQHGVSILDRLISITEVSSNLLISDITRIVRISTPILAAIE